MTNILLACSLVLSPTKFPAIADAIWKAEGGTKTAYPYGVTAVRTRNPRKVCLQTITTTWRRWDGKGCFLVVLGDRYCPVSVDPKGNCNWKRNVTLITKHKCRDTFPL